MGTSVTKSTKPLRRKLIVGDYDPKQTELGFSCHFEKGMINAVMFSLCVNM